MKLKKAKAKGWLVLGNEIKVPIGISLEETLITILDIALSFQTMQMKIIELNITDT
jgi:hypothetical protein